MQTPKLEPSPPTVRRTGPASTTTGSIAGRSASGSVSVNKNAKAQVTLALDGRHRWMFEQVSDFFAGDVTVADIEALMASRGSLAIVNFFLSATGPRRLLWYFQPKEKREGGTMRFSGAPRLAMFTGTDVPLVGKCVYCLRIKDKDVTPASVRDDVVIGEIEGSILDRMRDYLAYVQLPALERHSDWGSLGDPFKLLTKHTGGHSSVSAPKPTANDDGAVKAEGSQVDPAIAEFLESVHKFATVLTEAVNALNSSVVLIPAALIDRHKLENKPAIIRRVANNAEIVADAEDVLSQWMDQISHLLAEASMPQQHDDDGGPLAELQYWKARMAAFNSLVEQLRSRDCKIVVGILSVVESASLERWRELDSRVTDAANEAKDNVKYLYTLERFVEPLYKGDPSKMIEALPALINAVKMIHSIAKYYNTTERLTALFVRISSQMSITCRAFLSKEGSVFDQQPDTVLHKMRTCIDLNAAYKEKFRSVKDRLHLGLSEAHIFGSFDAFCARLQKLIDVVSTIQQFKELENPAIDRVDRAVDQFRRVVKRLRAIPYDILDARHDNFEQDYLAFINGIILLDGEIKAYTTAAFESASSAEKAFEMLSLLRGVFTRESLRADLESKHQLLLSRFAADLDRVRQLFVTSRENPDIPRNAPPVAGRIEWARQLLRRIERPLKLLETHTSVMTSPTGKAVVKAYNNISQMLVDYETAAYAEWSDNLESVKSALQAPVLVRHPRTNQLLVNLDSRLRESLHEVKAIQRLGLPLTGFALKLAQCEESIVLADTELEHTATNYLRVKTKPHYVYRDFMNAHFKRLDDRIKPGLSTVVWTSPGLPIFTAAVNTEAAALESLIDRANDIVESRIERSLHDMKAMRLLSFPKGEAWTPQQFLMECETRSAETAQALDMLNLGVEFATNDLINLVLRDLDAQQCEEAQPAIARLLHHFQRAAYSALVAATVDSLQAIRERMGHVAGTALGRLFMVDAQMLEGGLFRAGVELKIPEVVVDPPLEVIQTTVNSVVRHVLDISHCVYAWGQRRRDASGRAEASTSSGTLKSFHDELASDLHILKLVLLLAGALMRVRQSVLEHLQTFKKYDFLWRDNKSEVFKAFMRTNPTITDFERELSKYEAIATEIRHIIPSIHIGALELESTSLKQSLLAEVRGWKEQFGRDLNTKVSGDLHDIVQFIEDTRQRLNRNIEDLDDVRFVMEALSRLRNGEAELELAMYPVEEAYAMLQRHGLRISKEETEAVDNLRYHWRKLRTQAVTLQDKLSLLQPKYRTDLVNRIADFKADVKTFKDDYDTHGPMAAGIRPHVASERLRIFMRSFEERERKWLGYASGEELFGLAVTEYPELVAIKKELKLAATLYTLYEDVLQTMQNYADMHWAELDLGKVTAQLNDFNARCRKLPKATREWEAYRVLRQIIEDYTNVIPLLEMLSSRALLPRHWEAIETAVNHRFRREPDVFKLKHLLEAPILQHREEVEDICFGAVKEREIETKLRQIEDEWRGQEFTLAAFKKRGDIMLKGSATADLVASLEDTLLALSTLLAGRHNAPFRDRIQRWIHQLSTAAELLEQWVTVQSVWVYLEAVFVGGDIAKQLPREARRFFNIDRSWTKLMSRVQADPNVVRFCNADETLSGMLQHLEEQLELCQKSLSGYLEKKREAFPRLYFVSDPALLEILGQGSNPQAIQPHLKSVFDNIASVEFDVKQYNRILSMISLEGEQVPLSTPFVADGNVETWMGGLVSAMQQTMKDIVRQASWDALVLPMGEFIRRYPAQVTLLGLQIVWTRMCELALSKAKNEKNAMTNTAKQINDILAYLIHQMSQDLSPRDRVKLETLVTIQVHQRDVFVSLAKQFIKSMDHFEWLKQTRFYWRTEEDTCVISITDVDFRYCYEYLGVSERLVVTPLTDRCYITLAQAIGMGIGGAPAGPAGTGKTETVKDMGKTLGKYVVVFNCSDQMDYRGLGKIFKGLAQSGAWGCFDEFNRIKLEVLSVAHQPA